MIFELFVIARVIANIENEEKEKNTKEKWYNTMVPITDDLNLDCTQKNSPVC